jgi:hypothetical protein
MVEEFSSPGVDKWIKWINWINFVVISIIFRMKILNDSPYSLIILIFVSGEY